jgi:pyridoxal phosphate enzyme (YggS family)
VCVTKGFGLDAIGAVRGAGALDVAESYAQELVAKSAADPALLASLTVHFIGRVQTNKVRLVAPLVGLWQSVDRAEVAVEIARRAPGAAVLVQVNVSGEASKGGCPPAATSALATRCQSLGLVVRGLMTVGHSAGAAAAKPGFVRLRALADDLGLAECSMGMSDDLEAAVEAGSTMVRVGSALFGPRPMT